MSSQPSLLVTLVLALVVGVWGAVCWLASWLHTPSEGPMATTSEGTMATPNEGPMATTSEGPMATSQLGHSEAEVVAVKPKAKDLSPSYSREDTRILDRRVTNNTKPNCI